MTAYTSLNFPYQVSTDRPCDAPGVWCNFTSLVETQLLAIDTTLGRISPSVPAAKVRRTTPLTLTLNVQTGIPFETSVFDTDNMVNLATSPTILPHRSGRYLVTLSVQNITTTITAANNTIAITTGPVVTDPATGGTTWSTVSQGSTVGLAIGTGVASDNWYHAAAITNWTQGSDILGFGVMLAGDNTGILGAVELSAYWVSDKITFP